MAFLLDSFSQYVQHMKQHKSQQKYRSPMPLHQCAEGWQTIEKGDSSKLHCFHGMSLLQHLVLPNLKSLPYCRQEIHNPPPKTNEVNSFHLFHGKRKKQRKEKKRKEIETNIAQAKQFKILGPQNQNVISIGSLK